jgi:hypothetical protein
MNDHGHLTKLEQAGNIGVALGEVSEGLVTIDIDEGRIEDRFFEANPLLKQTLRTGGSRGVCLCRSMLCLRKPTSVSFLTGGIYLYLGAHVSSNSYSNGPALSLMATQSKVREESVI